MAVSSAMALGLSLAAHGASAQSLADKASSVRDGAVRFHFASRRGVCGDGDRYLQLGESNIGMYSSGGRRSPCVPGPVEVQVTMRGGEVERVETWAGPLRPRSSRDLGDVSTREATRYLLDVAAHARSGAATRAMLPAVLADSATVWPALLTIARDSLTRAHDTRREAAFWLSRLAAAAAAGHRDDLSNEDEHDDPEDVKGQAVFVLSQLPHGEGVPSLLDIARTNRDAHVRSRALFWLGQSGDPRALALFEALLGS
jgi:hypothetical protein